MMMFVRLIFAVSFSFLTGGCLSQPKTTVRDAGRCVPMTFAYQTAVRGQPKPIRLATDDSDPDFIDLGVIDAEGNRLTTFRIWRGDGRIEVWDWTKSSWVASGLCR